MWLLNSKWVWTSLALRDSSQSEPRRRRWLASWRRRSSANSFQSATLFSRSVGAAVKVSVGLYLSHLSLSLIITVSEKVTILFHSILHYFHFIYYLISSILFLQANINLIIYRFFFACIYIQYSYIIWFVIYPFDDTFTYSIYILCFLCLHYRCQRWTMLETASLTGSDRCWRVRQLSEQSGKRRRWGSWRQRRGDSNPSRHGRDSWWCDATRWRGKWECVCMKEWMQFIHVVTLMVLSSKPIWHYIVSLYICIHWLSDWLYNWQTYRYYPTNHLTDWLTHWLTDWWINDTVI